MTREELCIYACKYAIGELTRKGSSAFITSAHEGRQQITWVEVMEWLNREQKSEDAISRQAAQAKIKSICDEYRLSYEDGERKAATGGSAYALGHAFDDLPPVNLQPKTGHWIHLKHNKGKCSECHDVVLIAQMYGNANFCPNCGAKMIEPQESEVQDAISD